MISLTCSIEYESNSWFFESINFQMIRTISRNINTSFVQNRVANLHCGTSFFLHAVLPLTVCRLCSSDCLFTHNPAWFSKKWSHWEEHDTSKCSVICWTIEIRLQSSSLGWPMEMSWKKSAKRYQGMVNVYKWSWSNSPQLAVIQAT